MLALRLHCAHLGGVYRSGPPLVDAGSLGFGDPLKLALAPGREPLSSQHARTPHPYRIWTQKAYLWDGRFLLQ
jgi:hypothetical protein